MILSFGSCELDTSRRRVVCNGLEVPVEPQVFDLIRLLAENADRVVSRDEIVESVWGGRIVSEGAISSRIAAARKALGDNGSEQRIIRTIQRRGLQMMIPVVRKTTDKQEQLSSEAPLPATLSDRFRYLKGHKGERLVYLVQGEGTPVLRVSPAGWSVEEEQTSSVWRETAESLSGQHQQLRYSEASLDVTEDGKINTNLDNMAENIRMLADAAGFGRFAIVSVSGGVHHALRFAARYPDRVSRMVIQGGYAQGRSRRDGADSEKDIFRYMIDEGWKSEAQQIGGAFMLPYFPEGPLEAILDAARIFQSGLSRETELALRDLTNTADSTDILPLVTCPVLVIHGRHDTVHPVSEARKLVEGLSDAELWIMETANHLPLAGHALADDYTAAVLDFLSHDS